MEKFDVYKLFEQHLYEILTFEISVRCFKHENNYIQIHVKEQKCISFESDVFFVSTLK
jgi:hypothetical protein